MVLSFVSTKCSCRAHFGPLLSNGIKTVSSQLIIQEDAFKLSKSTIVLLSQVSLTLSTKSNLVVVCFGLRRQNLAKPIRTTVSSSMTRQLMSPMYKKKKKVFHKVFYYTLPAVFSVQPINADLPHFDAGIRCEHRERPRRRKRTGRREERGLGSQKNRRTRQSDPLQ